MLNKIDANRALCTFPSPVYHSGLIKVWHQRLIKKTSQQMFDFGEKSNKFAHFYTRPKIIAILHGNQRSPQSLIDRGGGRLPIVRSQYRMLVATACKELRSKACKEPRSKEQIGDRESEPLQSFSF